jgi:hypothetical protein
MGRATTAPTGPFHQERVRASHQAIGVPISSSSTRGHARQLEREPDRGEVGGMVGRKHGQCTASSPLPRPDQIS